MEPQRSPVNLMQRTTTLLAVWLMAVAVGAAQEKPEEAPRILMCIPLGVLPGETTKVTARGLLLEGATEVKTGDGRVQIQLVSQGKAVVPGNQDAQKVGDNQVEFEVVTPADYPPGNLEVVVATPKGEAKYSLPIGGEAPTVAEMEPNPGFKQSQAIALPQVVIGRIENPADVDVYAIDVQAGQKLHGEVHAERLGSGLDALLSIYDSRGRLVATQDDLSDSRDARLEVTAAAAGKWFVVVQDANDQGGPAHPYRLVITALQ